MWFLLLLATLGSAQPLDVVVNLYATVESADGYVNMRNSPSTEYGPRLQIPNGRQMLVRSCTSAPLGRRWCQVAYGTEYGYVYDAELRYAPARPTGDGTALGAGIADGFRWVSEEAVVVSSDGYLNLRAGPSSSQPVLRRLRNDEFLWVSACQRGAQGRRWCFVEAEAPGALGYVYDREVEYVSHEH